MISLSNATAELPFLRRPNYSYYHLPRHRHRKILH